MGPAWRVALSVSKPPISGKAMGVNLLTLTERKFYSAKEVGTFISSGTHRSGRCCWIRPMRRIWGAARDTAACRDCGN